jgi:hypothetical protein
MKKQSSFYQLPEGQTNTHKEPIAIIGIGCRFPGNNNSPEEFWKSLKNGIDAITEFLKIAGVLMLFMILTLINQVKLSLQKEDLLKM